MPVGYGFSSLLLRFMPNEIQHKKFIAQLLMYFSGGGIRTFLALALPANYARACEAKKRASQVMITVWRKRLESQRVSSSSSMLLY